MYYICIVDKGGSCGTVQDMGYYQPQQHLIRIKHLLTDIEVDQLLTSIRKTRKAPEVVGIWGPERDGLATVLDYENLDL